MTDALGERPKAPILLCLALLAAVQLLCWLRHRKPMRPKSSSAGTRRSTPTQNAGARVRST